MAEESKLVEDVVENNETTALTGVEDKFNPLAFTEDVYNADEEETKETKETKDVEGTKEVEEVESTNEDDADDKWAWDSKKEDKELEKEEEYNWEGTTDEKSEETPTTQESLNWAKVGEELGIEIESKEHFIQALNHLQEAAQQQQAPANDQTAELRSYLNFSDRDLVSEELKADGIEDSEIEESLDKLEDSGMMKMKAKSIRRVINNAIDQQTSQDKQQAQQSEQQRKQQAENAKKELKTQIKGMNEFMGGKVTKKQKEEVYRYATGDMMKEIYADHANVADVAMFMLYRKQIEKILRSQGLEDGKAAVMDSIVSPNLNSGKSKSNFKVKSGKFDPTAFMSE